MPKSMPDLFTFDGLGTIWRLGIFDVASERTRQREYAAIVAIALEFEENYSRFKQESYIGRLNHKLKISSAPLELFSMLEFAKQCAAVTEGHFTIAAGTRLEDIGYDAQYSLRKKGSLRPVGLLDKVLTVTGSTVRISPDTAIDLGGFGKGWLIDKLAAYLKSQGYERFLIDGGGDILVAGNALDGASIPLEDPRGVRSIIGEIPVSNGAIASSSPKYRHWPDLQDGGDLHHLVNPKSEAVITDVAAVYTYARTATAADTASTCLFVSPPRLHGYISSFFGASYCIVYADGSFRHTQDYPGKIFTRS